MAHLRPRSAAGRWPGPTPAPATASRSRPTSASSDVVRPGDRRVLRGLRRPERARLRSAAGRGEEGDASRPRRVFSRGGTAIGSGRDDQACSGRWSGGHAWTLNVKRTRPSCADERLRGYAYRKGVNERDLADTWAGVGNADGSRSESRCARSTCRRLRPGGRRAVAEAVVRRTQVRAALDHPRGIGFAFAGARCTGGMRAAAARAMVGAVGEREEVVSSTPRRCRSCRTGRSRWAGSSSTGDVRVAVEREVLPRELSLPGVGHLAPPGADSSPHAKIGPRGRRRRRTPTRPRSARLARPRRVGLRRPRRRRA